MKKIIPILSICILFAGCKSSEQKIIANAETFLKTGLNDPASYVLIDSKIIDTVKKKGALNEQLNKTYKEAMNYSDQNNNDYAIIVLDSAKIKGDSLQKIIDNVKIDSIFFIDTRFNFRAKNPLNAIVLGQQIIRYDVNKKAFSIL